MTLNGAVNGHHSDDGPELEEQGQRPNGRRPSLGDLLMSQDSGGMPNPWIVAKELITGSTKAEEYLPRGRHTAKGIVRDKRIVARLNRIKTGSSGVRNVMWIGYHMVIGLDGQARKEVVKMSGNVTQDPQDARLLQRMTRSPNSMERGA